MVYWLARGFWILLVFLKLNEGTSFELKLQSLFQHVSACFHFPSFIPHVIFIITDNENFREKRPSHNRDFLGPSLYPRIICLSIKWPKTKCLKINYPSILACLRVKAILLSSFILLAFL